MVRQKPGKPGDKPGDRRDVFLFSKLRSDDCAPGDRIARHPDLHAAELASADLRLLNSG